jgi:hypothetical protein
MYVCVCPRAWRAEGMKSRGRGTDEGAWGEKRECSISLPRRLKLLPAQAMDGRRVLASWWCYALSPYVSDGHLDPEGIVMGWAGLAVGACVCVLASRSGNANGTCFVSAEGNITRSALQVGATESPYPATRAASKASARLCNSRGEGMKSPTLSTPSLQGRGARPRCGKA